MPQAIPLRHELKYYINELQYTVLSGVISKVMAPDENGDARNEYHIRSLYFDDIYNSAMFDKLNGVRHRDKYRIRIYKMSDKQIQLECKTKVGSLISKRSLQIPRLLCDQLMAGDPSGLESSGSGLLQDMYREMRVSLLRPVVLVDYVREAYVYPAEEVRITFDKQLRTGLFSKDLFSDKVPTIPPLDNSEIILEVKYNRVFPPHLRALLGSYCQNPLGSAISKYTICRRFEGINPDE